MFDPFADRLDAVPAAGDASSAPAPREGAEVLRDELTRLGREEPEAAEPGRDRVGEPVRFLRR